MARRLVTDMRGEEAGPEDRGLGALVQSEMAESGELGPRGQEPRGEGTQGRLDTPDMDSTPLLSSVEHDMVRCLHLGVGQGAVRASSMLFSSITTSSSSSTCWVS